MGLLGLLVAHNDEVLHLIKMHVGVGCMCTCVLRPARPQVGMLDLQAADAGLGAGLGEQGLGGGEGEAGGQGQGSHQTQQQMESLEGMGKVWWFAQEEVQRGQLLGVSGSRQVGAGTLGWLEDQHVYVLCASFWTWYLEMCNRAAAGGTAVRPPPLLAARLAARAAEALCRLCRGQGLGGTYGPAPEWLCAKIQVGLPPVACKFRSKHSHFPLPARQCLNGVRAARHPTG